MRHETVGEPSPEGSEDEPEMNTGMPISVALLLLSRTSFWSGRGGSCFQSEGHFMPCGKPANDCFLTGSSRDP